MACPCEIIIETENEVRAIEAFNQAYDEVKRIETKFSRYNSQSVISHINNSEEPFPLDAETAQLFDLARHCFEISDGLFDVTSGILRRVWRFDGSANIPSQSEIDTLLPFIGFDKLKIENSVLIMPNGFEIDFGGIGKEYAVDAVFEKIAEIIKEPYLVNFGGDLRVSGRRNNNRGWGVAIQTPDIESKSDGIIEIFSGAITTSGDATRYLLKDGIRYSHILNPKTGWPVKNPPRSVTIAATNCLQAGILSTLAMLMGEECEAFLRDENIKSWVIR